MKLFPTLFDEAMRVFLSPVNQIGYAFARPALSLLEFSQCVTQAVAPSARKDAKDAAKDASEGGTVSLLQLPHVDEKVALALARNVKKPVAGKYLPDAYRATIAWFSRALPTARKTTRFRKRNR